MPEIEPPTLEQTVTSAIETYWLEGMDDDDMAEWWGTQDAHDTAAALGEAISDALGASFIVSRRPATGDGDV